MPHHPGRARRMREMPSGVLHPPACAFTPFKETRRGMGGLHRPTGRPPCAWAAVSPLNQRLPARDPHCGERPSPLSTARLLSPLLSDLLSSTLFAECCFSARQNPMKPLTDPLRSSSKRAPRWHSRCSSSRGRLRCTPSQKLLSLLMGSSPQNPPHLHRGRKRLKCQESTTSVPCPGKLRMLKPHYSPSPAPWGQAGIFSPPG